MLRLTRLLPDAELDAIENERVLPALTLPFDLRQRTRLRATLDDGRDVALILPRGSRLVDGCVLASSNGEKVRLRAAIELLSTVNANGERDFARACYHLGKRHVPLQIGEVWLGYQHDHVLDELMRGLGFEVHSARRTFEPEPGAYASKHAHSRSAALEHAHAEESPHARPGHNAAIAASSVNAKDAKHHPVTVRAAAQWW